MNFYFTYESRDNLCLFGLILSIVAKAVNAKVYVKDSFRLGNLKIRLEI